MDSSSERREQLVEALLLKASLKRVERRFEESEKLLNACRELFEENQWQMPYRMLFENQGVL